jgi:hypothetical protein
MIVIILLGAWLFYSALSPQSPPIPARSGDENLQDYVGVWVNSNVPSPDIIPNLTKFVINESVGSGYIRFYFQDGSNVTYPDTAIMFASVQESQDAMHKACAQSQGQDQNWYGPECPMGTSGMLEYNGQPIGDIGVQGVDGFALSYINATALRVYQAMPYQVTSNGVVSPTLEIGVFLRASTTG